MSDPQSAHPHAPASSPVCGDRSYESDDKAEQIELLKCNKEASDVGVEVANLLKTTGFEKDEFECQLFETSYATQVSITESLKTTNELPNQEVVLLRGEVDSLKRRCEQLELELQKSTKKAEEAIRIAGEEAAKTRAARDFISSTIPQITEIAERLLPGWLDTLEEEMARMNESS